MCLVNGPIFRSGRLMVKFLMPFDSKVAQRAEQGRQLDFNLKLIHRVR